MTVTTEDNTASGVVDPDSDSADIPSSKFYIRRGQRRLHVNRALKVIIGGRDWMSNERSKRHIVTEVLPHIHKILGNHDIILYRDYAVRSGGQVKVHRITSLEDEQGKRLQSTTKASTCKFRGSLYDMDSDTYELSIPATTR